jgi:hypothetical protein
MYSLLIIRPLPYGRDRTAVAYGRRILQSLFGAVEVRRCRSSPASCCRLLSTILNTGISKYRGHYSLCGSRTRFLKAFLVVQIVVLIGFVSLTGRFHYKCKETRPFPKNIKASSSLSTVPRSSRDSRNLPNSRVLFSMRLHLQIRGWL